MFRDAIEGAMHYTQPVVSFWKTAEGECKTGVAACVVINQDGWIVTAAHVVQHAIALSQAESEARSWESQRDQARADQTISAKERSKRLSALGKRAKDTVVRSATSWGFHSGGLANISIIPEIDLAV
ncbi:MAG: trypsin-like serine protease, partial [Aestuariivirga sp.]